MFTENDVIKKLSKITDNFKVKKLSEEDKNELLKIKAPTPVAPNDNFGLLTKLFDDEIVRATSVTPLDSEDHCLLMVIYYKPLDDVEVVLQNYTFRSVDSIINTLNDRRYLLKADYFEIYLN